jgi:hypothetical protein
VTIVGNWKLQPVSIEAMVYADDVLITEKEELQRAVIEWCGTFEERGLEVNTRKGKVMQISKMVGQQVMNIQWKGVKLEQVQSTEYLEIVINDD